MNHIDTLRENIRRISVVRELYEQLKEEYKSTPEGTERKEHLELQILHAKERILKLTMKNKGILQKLEVKCHV